MDNYLNLFFEEKEIKAEAWEFTDKNGMIHFMATEVVIESILNAPDSEKKQITNTLRKLDFHNAPIEPFLKHLGQCMVDVYAG